MTFIIVTLVSICYLHIQIKVNALYALEALEALEVTDADIELLRAELPACIPQIEVIEKYAHNLNTFLLESQSIRSLKAMASAAHLPRYGNMTKAQLVLALAA